MRGDENEIGGRVSLKLNCKWAINIGGDENEIGGRGFTKTKSQIRT